MTTRNAPTQTPLIRYCVVLQEAGNPVPQRWDYANAGTAFNVLDIARKGPSTFVSGYLMIAKPKSEAA